jgi:hypothetical protein
MLDDPEKTLVIIFSKYGCHMLAQLIKIIYMICKL